VTGQPVPGSLGLSSVDDFSLVHDYDSRREDTLLSNEQREAIRAQVRLFGDNAVKQSLNESGQNRKSAPKLTLTQRVIALRKQMNTNIEKERNELVQRVTVKTVKE
jgi:hypothetical protein